jgi:phage-related protein
MKTLVDTTATFLFHNLIPAIGRIFASLPVAIGEFMQSGVPRFMEAGQVWVEKIVEGAQTALPGLIANLLNSLTSMSASFGSALSGFVDVGLKLVKSIADGIIKNIPTIIQTVPKIITNIANIINNNAPKIIATGAVILKNLVVGLIKAIPVLIANIPTIIKAAVAVFEAFQWANIGKLVVSGIAKGLKAGIGVVKGAGKKIGTSIVNAIKSVPSKVKGFVNKIKSHLLFAGLAGKVQSNFNKIKEKITNPIQKAKDKVKGFVDKIKGFFPISIGKWLSNLPTLSLKTASKTILGKTITYPVGFSWNAKAMQQPYMFTGATLFGAGEAGDEMLYGRKALMRDIREATGGNGGTTYNIGDITLDVSSLEDIATLEQFVKIASRAKRFK